jgi:hypothetical protein
VLIKVDIAVEPKDSGPLSQSRRLTSQNTCVALAYGSINGEALVSASRVTLVQPVRNSVPMTAIQECSAFSDPMPEMFIGPVNAL